MPHDTDNGYMLKMILVTLNVVDAGAAALEASLNVAEECIKRLVDAFNKGAVDTTNSEKENEVTRFEKEACELRSKLVVRRCQKFKLAGEFVDKFALEEADEADWSYIDLLVSRYRTPAHAALDIFRPRDPGAQDQFRTAVFEAYANQEPPCCVLTGIKSNVTAAHILPYNMGEFNASYLFGPATHENGHIMCPQNGLPMFKFVEEAFEQGKFTIVPGDKGGEWKALVLDQAYGAEFENAYQRGPLQNRVLVFQTEFRPDKRYLYFAHVIAILRRQRYEGTGWWKGVPDGSLGVWATPGKFLRTSALMVLARRMGHMATKEAAEMLGLGGDDIKDDKSSGSSQRSRLFSDVVSLSTRGIKFPEEDEGDDEDDGDGDGDEHKN